MLLKSGIKGFDKLLQGGFLKKNVILVEGVPGAGKTTFGLEFIYKGIVEFNEPGIVITFEEFPEQLYRDAANYGWNLRELEEKNLLRVVCTSPELVLDSSSHLLDSVVEEISARRLLLDSITQFNMELSNISELRRTVYSLCNGLKRMGLTSVLVKEVDDYGLNKASFEEYLVDTVIRLYFEESYRYRKRYVEILKSRGQDFISGKYPFKFTLNGLKIMGMPEIIQPNQETFSFEKVSSGIEGLDNILGGGFLRGTSIIVGGASGTGKTVMGIHYLLEGTKTQEKGLLLTTEDSAPVLKRYIDSFDLDFITGCCKHEVYIMDGVFSDTSLEEVIGDLINIVKSNNIQRIVIDFINTFLEITDNLMLLKPLLRNLIHSLNLLGCTSILILNENQAEVVGSPLKNLIQPLVHGEINLSSKVKKGKRYHSLEVRKMKGQKYIAGMHLAEITNEGMAVYQRIGGS